METQRIGPHRDAEPDIAIAEQHAFEEVCGGAFAHDAV
jgi:hypothetical protein